MFYRTLQTHEDHGDHEGLRVNLQCEFDHWRALLLFFPLPT
jgi:hypothetical protein